MKNIKESCINYLYSEDSRKDIKAVLSPIGDLIYNEMYLYIWIICFYNIFLFIAILANLYILLKIVKLVRGLKIYVPNE
jgi:hypothetical protein